MNDISDSEFRHFQRFIYDEAGISLSSAKKALVSGRLSKRLNARRLDSFGAYIRLLRHPDERQEVQAAIDLLTTNETYFFREPKHFDLLRNVASAAPPGTQPFRVWSAATSSGEEAFSIAMVLADSLRGHPFEVLGSDICTRVLAKARTGHYSGERTDQIPQPLLVRFCLRGKGDQEGTLLIDRNLRRHVRFLQVNLNACLPDLGRFDVIFLRNVMIYFDAETKRQVVARLLSVLKPGGHFCIGHSESLNGVNSDMVHVAPSIYRKK